jgi:glycosyltransferase involved in cell wall biosynthesis
MTPEASGGPLVSIGLPVYNGERFLTQAVESILSQTYESFELIISDNGSTDRTEAICRKFAARDPRVQYHRVEDNRGAAWNFNRVVELAKGPYFKWVAHDDMIAPSYLEACVRVLEEDPSVVLCCTGVREIDSSGATVRDRIFDHRIDSSRVDDRFFDLVLAWHNCYYIFGVIRRSALDATPLMGNYSSGDSVLIARLGLLGRFRQLEDMAFLARSHEDQSMKVFNKFDTEIKGMDAHSYTEWFDPSIRGKLIFPHWRILSEMGSSVLGTRMQARENLVCGYVLARWVYRFRRQLTTDLVRALRATAQARRSSHDEAARAR